MYKRCVLHRLCFLLGISHIYMTKKKIQILLHWPLFSMPARELTMEPNGKDEEKIQHQNKKYWVATTTKSKKKKWRTHNEWKQHTHFPIFPIKHLTKAIYSTTTAMPRRKKFQFMFNNTLKPFRTMSQSFVVCCSSIRFRPFGSFVSSAYSCATCTMR